MRHMHTIGLCLAYSLGFYNYECVPNKVRESEKVQALVSFSELPQLYNTSPNAQTL